MVTVNTCLPLNDHCFALNDHCLALNDHCFAACQLTFFIPNNLYQYKIAAKGNR